MSDALTFRMGSLEEAIKRIAIPESEQRKIMQRTISATLRWAANYVRNNLVRKASFPRDALKVRVFASYKAAGLGYGSIWLGLNPISLKHLGAKETESGVSAGPASVPGGFIGPGRHVYKRRGRSRLPIDKVEMPVADKARPFIAEAAEKIQEKLAENFEKAYLQVLGK